MSLYMCQEAIERKNMKNVSANRVAGTMSLFIVMPIWYFLMYTILKNIPVDRLVWFLFWAYVPISWLTIFIAKIIGNE